MKNNKQIIPATEVVERNSVSELKSISDMNIGLFPEGAVECSHFVENEDGSKDCFDFIYLEHVTKHFKLKLRTDGCCDDRDISLKLYTITVTSHKHLSSISWHLINRRSILKDLSEKLHRMKAIPGDLESGHIAYVPDWAAVEAFQIMKDIISDEAKIDAHIDRIQSGIEAFKAIKEGANE